MQRTRVSIEELSEDPMHARMLTYPKFQKNELNRRLKELRSLGITALEFTGDKQISNVNVLGKGCVGIVLAALIDGQKVALKVRRLDADRSRMLHEAQMLKMANSVQVGPLLLGYTKNLLLMQFVEGSLIPIWLQKRVGKSRVRRVLLELIKQCFLLDSIGLDHGELSHAPKHVIVDKANRPYIVDFETASVRRRPANVTSMSQFLFLSGISESVIEKIGASDKNRIVNALRSYKMSNDKEDFRSVLNACGL